MKCTNEACPYRQEPGPVECPAANNGCGGYMAEEAQRDYYSLFRNRQGEIASRQLAAEMEERDRELERAVATLAGIRPCEACVHGKVFANGDCEAADYECMKCLAACVCRDCVNGSLWKWEGGPTHEIP